MSDFLSYSNIPPKISSSSSCIYDILLASGVTLVSGLGAVDSTNFPLVSFDMLKVTLLK